MEAVDKNVPQPVRDIDKPFAMPIEDIFSISGRGTVVTGRIERGKVKVGEEIEIVGFRPTQKKVVTGVEMFRKLLDEGIGGRQRGLAAARHGKRRCGARAGGVQAGFDHAAHEVQGRSVRIDEGRRRAAHAVFHGIPAAVLFPHDGRDRRREAAEGVEMVMPGDNVSCEVTLITPVALEKGLRFAIREGGHTVGAGAVTEIIE